MYLYYFPSGIPKCCTCRSIAERLLGCRFLTKNHVSMEEGACSKLLRVNFFYRWTCITFMGCFPFFLPAGALFCCISVCTSHAIWLCEAEMFPQCPHPRRVVPDWSLTDSLSWWTLQGCQQQSCSLLRLYLVLTQLNSEVPLKCLPEK